uniref:Uncharacterized protein n=1 Tax=Solanum lycopersicum TaxID=4081 RepID=A0A3Q7H9R9_SOLLC
MKPLSIFNQPGKGSKKRTRRNLSAIELQSASTHVLLNCPQVKPFVEKFSWGPIKTYSMNKYVVNGFKFTTEEYSKYKKTNNSGVWVKGGDGNLDGVDYYGVLKEVLEMEYSEQSC